MPNDRFCIRVENAKQRLGPRGVDNHESLLDMAEATPPTNQLDGLTASAAVAQHWGSSTRPGSSYCTCDYARQLRFITSCGCLSDSYQTFCVEDFS